MALRLLAVFVVPLIVLVTWFVAFRPVALGGPVQYVIVEGQSMEPTFHSGDLVLIRQHDEYEVGDIVSFKTPIGMVIHRVVDGSTEDGFVTQGDNNNVVDPWRSDPSAIAGEAWLHIPGGIHLRWISPVMMGLGFIGIVALALRRYAIESRSETPDPQIEAPSH